MRFYQFHILFTLCIVSNALNENLISNFTVNVVKTQQVVLFGCSEKDLMNVTRFLIRQKRLVLCVNIKRNFSLENILTRHNHVRTSVILDCSCSECRNILRFYSESRSFNKTYQWMVWDLQNYGLNQLEQTEDLYNIGPNAQMTFVNSSGGGNYFLFDVHSKGRHLKAPIEVVHYADWIDNKLFMHRDIFHLQGIRNRGQFKGLQLRGVVVIDRENITTDEQVHKLVTSTNKEDGIATFVKYHYDLVCFMKDQLNFTINYRNVRSWAGRLRGGPFRLGFLGVLKRNEADIGASAAFNRINRFVDYDNIHMSWKFDSAFIYRFTSEIDADGASGDFLAPFVMQVWVFSCGLTVFLICVWYFVSWNMRRKNRHEEEDKDGFLLKTFAALCQQGLDPVPKNLPSRTIVLTLFVFSLMMYNFYTSSVVGGLLNSSERGPKTVAEIVNSPLKLSFEDIGYYKVLFKNPANPIVQRMYKTKVLPKRIPSELPIFTHVKDAIPYLKKGGYAFHCERIDAYPEIARLFDANEICDLRVVSGLLETEVIAMFIVKNSMYTELFRIILCRAREVGIIKRTIAIHKPDKPECQASYTVYPVAFSGVSNAFFLLGGAMFISGLCLAAEIIYVRMKEDKPFAIFGNDKNR